jgi:hypothetical protein
MATIWVGFAVLMCCLVWAFLKFGGGFQHYGRGSVEIAMPPNAHLLRTSDSRRRTERLLVLVPIHVSGQDVSGVAFEDDTTTRNISGYGASVILSRQLRPGQEIVISRENRVRTGTCRVVYEMERREGKHLYGVVFVDPNVDLWGVRDLLTEALPAPAQAGE